MAVTHYNHAFLYSDGARSKSPPLVGTHGDIATISCASFETCVAVSTGGDAVTWPTTPDAAPDEPVLSL